MALSATYHLRLWSLFLALRNCPLSFNNSWVNQARAWYLWYLDRGLYGYYGYSRINVEHVWALEHCVATGILATTDYTFTIPD